MCRDIMDSIPYKRIIFLIIALILLLFLPVKAEAPKPVYVKPLTVEETIVKYVTYFAAPAKEITSLFRCESNFRQDVVGAEGEIGVGQIKPATFIYLSGLMGEKLDIDSYHDQIKLVTWLSVNEPQELWQWTTWRALKNGGVYTFTSKKTGITYTVHCQVK